MDATPLVDGSGHMGTAPGTVLGIRSRDIRLRSGSRGEMEGTELRMEF